MSEDPKPDADSTSTSTSTLTKDETVAADTSVGDRVRRGLRKRSDAIVLAGLMALFVGYAICTPMQPLHGDGYYTYLWSRSIAFDGDMDLANDYVLCGDPWRMTAPAEPGLSVRNQWSPGPSVGWVPMLLLARALVAVGAFPDMNPAQAQGCHGPVSSFGLIGTVLMTLLTMWLVFRWTRRHTGSAPALLATAGVAFASPLTFYGAWLLSYGHAPAAFAVALFLERWDATRGSRTLARWGLLGALLGLAMLMRPQLAVLVVAPFVEWCRLAREDALLHDARKLRGLVLAGVVFTVLILVVFWPQLYAWRVAYGTYFALPQGPHYMRWGEPSLDGVLFATTGGLLFWNPLLYLAFFGLAGALFQRGRANPRALVGLMLLLVVSLTLYVNAAVWDYWGSMGFSNRRFTALAAPFAFGLAISFEWLIEKTVQRPRFVAGLSLGVVVFAFGAWNLAAMVGVNGGRILSWRENRGDILYEQIFHELAQGTFERVGNPVTWPASLPFAVHFDAHPRHYDGMRGMSVFYAEYQDRRPRPREDVASFTSSPLHMLYVVDGFERDGEARHIELEPGANGRLLIPLFLDEVRGIAIDWAVGDGGRGPQPCGVVRIRWNGHELPPVALTGADRATRLDVPPHVPRVGVNEFRVTVDGHPLRLFSMRFIPLAGPPAPEVPSRCTASNADP